jgi:uncharacterized protein (DUF1015 family)
MTAAPTPSSSPVTSAGVQLWPFRALRPNVAAPRLASLLCPPYDVIDQAQRRQLIEADPDNAVTVILPEPVGDTDRYAAARERLDSWVSSGLFAVDADPALYVYEMAAADGAVTRGLLGALTLRDPADGVILPHEDTMADPVADRLAVMMATQANLEPIYLVYDGGGAASSAVADVHATPPLAATTTPDGVSHRLWALRQSDQLAAIAADLAGRRALIADGHHRYATYREMQARLTAECGPGPWDRGLTLLVDSARYGPQVHAIHRVLPSLPLEQALRGAAAWGAVRDCASPEAALADAEQADGFAVVLTDGARVAVLTDPDSRLARAAVRPGVPQELSELDVTVLHRGLVETAWGLPDTVEDVGYAHSLPEALAAARTTGGTAVLVRPTPVAAVAAVAAKGARMPRKSTLFTPKPASGLLMRRFVDEQPAAR